MKRLRNPNLVWGGVSASYKSYVNDSTTMSRRDLIYAKSASKLIKPTRGPNHVCLSVKRDHIEVEMVWYRGSNLKEGKTMKALNRNLTRKKNNSGNHGITSGC